MSDKNPPKNGETTDTGTLADEGPLANAPDAPGSPTPAPGASEPVMIPITEIQNAGMAALARKKCAIMGAIQRVVKTRESEQGWAYATDADFLDEIRPAMAEAGLALSVRMEAVEETQIEDPEGPPTFRTRVDVVFRLTCSETGAYEDAPWSATGVDSEDKGISKALSRAEKYFLGKTFLMSSGEDPDAPPVPNRSFGDPKDNIDSRPAGKSSRERLRIVLQKIRFKSTAESDSVIEAMLGRPVDSETMTQADTNKVAALLGHALDMCDSGPTCRSFLTNCVDNGAQIDSKRALDSAWTNHQATGA